MDVTASVDAPCSQETLFEVVADLGRYPEWLEIVARADPAGNGAWAVDLRGRLGPLAKMKRLRMIRSECVAPSSVRFEREELDGRSHSPWVLSAAVTPSGSSGSHLEMQLHYGGGLFGPVIERLLRDEIERSKPRLLALVR